MAKIVVSYQPTFIPIIKRLYQAGHTIIATHPPFAQNLRDLDIQAQAMVEVAGGAVSGVAFTEAAKILTNIQPSKNGFGPGAKEFMKDSLKGFLYPRLADLVSFVLILDKVIKPDLILVHNDVEPLLRAAAQWGREHNVPVLHIPHAVYLDIEKGAPGDDIHDIVTASHLGVAGWFQREWYEKRGAKNITETGLPQFDQIATIRHEPQAARIRLGLNAHQPVVTYASSWRQDTNLLGCHDGVEETYRLMLEVMRRLPQVQFIVKLHPRSGNDSINWHVNEAKAAGVHCTVTPHHLDSCLQASDAVLTYSGSNLLLEASFFPWLRLMATQGFEDDPEVIKVSTDPPDLETVIEIITGALSQEPAELTGFRAKYVGQTDGKAGERIAGLVERLCQR